MRWWLYTAERRGSWWSMIPPLLVGQSALAFKDGAAPPESTELRQDVEPPQRTSPRPTRRKYEMTDIIERMGKVEFLESVIESLKQQNAELRRLYGEKSEQYIAERRECDRLRSAAQSQCSHLGRQHHTGGWNCPACGAFGAAPSTGLG